MWRNFEPLIIQWQLAPLSLYAAIVRGWADWRQSSGYHAGNARHEPGSELKLVDKSQTLAVLPHARFA